MIHQVSPFLYESSDSRVNRGFNTTKARRVITNESAIPIANVNCGVIQGLAKACTNGPSNVPREMAAPDFTLRTWDTPSGQTITLSTLKNRAGQPALRSRR